MDKLLAGVRSAVQIRKLQADFHRELQNAYVSTAITPFLPAYLIEVQFGEMANAVARAVDLDAPDAFERVQEARQQLAGFAEAVATVDSVYADRYLGGLAERLVEDLETRFADSPLSHPASLRLADPRKRFPLSVQGAELQLQLEILNEGAGPARNVRVDFEADGTVELLDPALALPSVSPGGRTLMASALVMEPCEQTTLMYEIAWRDADGEPRSRCDELRLRAQDAHVDWDELRRLNPYPSRAITDDRRLAGRELLLSALSSLVDGPEVGSTRVSGEKRVGKTSVVRSLQTRLERASGERLVVAYVDVNKLGVDSGDAAAAIAALLREIARSLSEAAADHIGRLDLPDFGSDAVGVFSSFLEGVRRRLGDRGILVIVDEFDELPYRVFDREGVGDPFFKALKAFSSDGDCGFVLVGGERLPLLIGNQLDRLNAFREHRVDYIDEEHFPDYVELVRKPVAGYLEVEGEAIRELHHRTAGHPYYTSLVCRQLVALALDRRDSHVTLVELDDAARSRSLRRKGRAEAARRAFAGADRLGNGGCAEPLLPGLAARLGARAAESRSDVAGGACPAARGRGRAARRRR